MRYRKTSTDNWTLLRHFPSQESRWVSYEVLLNYCWYYTVTSEVHLQWPRFIWKARQQVQPSVHASYFTFQPVGSSPYAWWEFLQVLKLRKLLCNLEDVFLSLLCTRSRVSAAESKEPWGSEWRRLLLDRFCGRLREGWVRSWRNAIRLATLLLLAW